MYWYPPFQDNFLELIHDQASHKVDHPPEAAKDVCDGTVGAVYNCFCAQGMAIEDLIHSSLTWKPDPANVYEMALAAAIDMSTGAEPKTDKMPRRVNSTAELREAYEEENDWYSQLINELQDD
jgi:hypothetical protein